MRALVIALCLAGAPALAIEPPDDAELIEQQRIVQHLLAKPVGREELPHQMWLWFGREFTIECERDETTCSLYVLNYDSDRRINFLRLVAVIPF